MARAQPWAPGLWPDSRAPAPARVGREGGGSGQGGNPGRAPPKFKPVAGIGVSEGATWWRTPPGKESRAGPRGPWSPAESQLLTQHLWSLEVLSTSPSFEDFWEGVLFCQDDLWQSHSVFEDLLKSQDSVLWKNLTRSRRFVRALTPWPYPQFSEQSLHRPRRSSSLQKQSTQTGL